MLTVIKVADAEQVKDISTLNYDPLKMVLQYRNILGY